MNHSARQPMPPSTLSAASTRVRQWFLSMRARLGAARLDRELAEGAKPDIDPLLRERARRLQSRESRQRLALGLDRAVDQVQRPLLYAGNTPAHSPAVREAVSTLQLLIRRLRGPRPVSPEGVARLEILLGDRSESLYSLDAEPDLRTAAQAALASLDPGFRRSPCP